MNRVLIVDTRNHTMLVEPGVSFYDVINYFEENNLPLTMDIPDPAWGSPIGHALERGFAHTYSENGRDRWDTVCGMEVVLGNGEIVRTGPGACEGALTWQDQKWGIGPYVDGIFSQSNFGVITKMGFWIRPAHEGYRSLTVFVPNYDDLVKMVDLDSYLQNAGIVNGMTVMGAPMFGGGFMLFNMPPTMAQDAPPALGKQVFDDWCGICHGPPDGASGGGTETLAALYRDTEIPAQLEDRTDLTEELVVTLTREGRNTMPNFRKTEISDSELEALVAFLVEEGEE